MLVKQSTDLLHIVGPVKGGPCSADDTVIWAVGMRCLLVASSRVVLSHLLSLKGHCAEGLGF